MDMKIGTLEMRIILEYLGGLEAYFQDGSPSNEKLMQGFVGAKTRFQQVQRVIRESIK